MVDFEQNSDLRVADFTNLPFSDEAFDLIFDRGALTCAGTQSMNAAVSEIYRCLKPQGHFFFNPISDTDSSYRAGRHDEDGVMTEIEKGDYVGVGQIRFISRTDIDHILPQSRWNRKRIERVEISDMLNPYGKIISSWRVEVQKI